MSIKPLPADMPTIIQEIIDAVSREVTAYTYTVSGCSYCFRDPVTDLSMDAFCPVCDGSYWIKNYTPTAVSGYVFWGPSDEINWQSGGILLEGECRLQVGSGYFNEIESADYFVIDGKEMYVKSKKYRGVPKLNRVLVTLWEKE